MSRVRGGRAARRAARQDGAGSGPITAIWPGIEGGQYRPLSSNGVEAIHRTALRILAEVGIANASPRCIETVTESGGAVSSEGRLLFPSDLVERVLATAGRNFKLFAQRPEFDLDPSGERIHLGTSGAAVHIIDSETGDVRDSRLADLYDMARLAEVLPNIHMFQRTVVARDIADTYSMELNTAYACAAGTTKPIGTSFSAAETMRDATSMFHMIAGSQEAWRARPFCCVSTCFIVPPLTFASEALSIIECAAETGTPLKLVSAGQAGATSPAPLAGAVAQQTAEVLSGLIYVNLLNPGHPALFGALPFVSDLRTGAMSGGSAEQGVLMAACAQMAQFYGIPCAVSAGMTDSKMPDFQAGYEKGITELLSALAGANLIYEAAGMYGSLLAASKESFVLDNDLIGSVLRATRGLEINEEALAFNVIKEVCLGGPGHFLGSDQTINVMQSDYYYPALADRDTPQAWQDSGTPSLLDQAREKTRQLLAKDPGPVFGREMNERLRARFSALKDLQQSPAN